MVVDTISSRLFLGDTFRFWKADQSSALVTFGTGALGAEFTMAVRTPQLYVASYMGVGGITTPQAELDVAGSIRCSMNLTVGNIDMVERILAHGTTLATHTTGLASKLSSVGPATFTGDLSVSNKLNTKQLYVAEYMGIGGITTPQAELDVAADS